MSKHLSRFPKGNFGWILLLWLVFVLSCSSANKNPVSRSSTLPQTSLADNSQPSGTPDPQANKPSQSSNTAVVISTQANLRKGPGSSQAVILKVEKDDALNLVNPLRSGPWYNVLHVPSGKVGWINGNSIKLIESPTARLEQERPPSRPSAPRATKSDTYRGPVQSETAPSGATARCRDGSYSFSQNRRGTCSHHGGVAEWL